jgi:hypothetical protein
MAALRLHNTYEQVVDSINDPQPLWTEYDLNGALVLKRDDENLSVPL